METQYAEFDQLLPSGAASVKLPDGKTTEIEKDCIVTVVPDDKHNAVSTVKHLVLSLNGTTEHQYREIKVSGLPEQFLSNAMSTDFPFCLGNSSVGLFYVVISTNSGLSQAEVYYENVIKKLLASSIPKEQALQIVFTESERSITEFAEKILEKANSGVHQTILLLSGDGGVIDILNVLSLGKRSPDYTCPTLSIIAMGTGNALANSIGVNRDQTKGLRQFCCGEPHALPIFEVRFSQGSVLLTNEGKEREPLPLNESSEGILYGAVVCSWALHASLVSDSDTTEYRKYGSERFSMAAKELLAPSDGSAPHTYKAKITLFKKSANGQTSTEVMECREHKYVLVTLVSNLEEKLIISPESRPLDGQLRLVHLGAVSSEQIMEFIGLAYQGGRHVEKDTIGYGSIQGMRIDFEEEEDRWRRICVDGKIVQVGKGGWVEVVKSPLEVLNVLAER